MPNFYFPSTTLWDNSCLLSHPSPISPEIARPTVNSTGGEFVKLLLSFTSRMGDWRKSIMGRRGRSVAWGIISKGNNGTMGPSRFHFPVSANLSQSEILSKNFQGETT